MKRPPIFALIDCNNFFVSCERLFRPDLEGKPVVVLSSNDGCAVARSNEVKALGIPMGAPAFKYREMFEHNNVIRFSANFELYGNVSRRITALLTSITPRIEIYSVDESFLDLSELHITDYEAWGRAVRDLVMRWVGIPVSIGIAPTKTLAKLASERSKKDAELDGVLSFVKSRENREKAEFSQIDHEKIKDHLSRSPVASIWGIGWRLAPKLRAEGIGTAWDVAMMRPQHAQQLMGINGRQIVAELNGTSCHKLELEGRLPQSIASTRTFGEDTGDIYAIEAALATFITTASFKLRRSQQLTKRVTLFATTSKHKPGYASWYRELHFTQPTADTGSLITSVLESFREFYNPRIMYHRAGITLHDFVPDGQLQTDMLGTIDIVGHDKAKSRMAAFDAINNLYGKRTMRFAAEIGASTWKPKYQLRSPRYVSRWNELPLIKVQ